MSKQAVLLAVDVGHSMDESFSDSSSRAKIALECCKLTLQQKIFNNSNHQLGLIVFGDNDSDDGNSLLLHQIQKPTVEFVRKVQELSEARFDSTKSGGDIFSCINYSVHMINQHVGKKKFVKRMFLFTNGTGASSFSHEDIFELADKLMAMQIKLNVVPVDFMTTYDLAENKIDVEILDPNQESNARMLIELKRLAEDFVQIFPASLAIELYKRFRKRDTNPMARYKGFLEFTPGLEVEICTYKAIRKQRLKSLARYDTSVPFDPTIPKNKEVILETNYVVQGEESGNIVNKENIMNAYHYGPQLVPISPILQIGSKILEDKNFRLLGFIDKGKVPRHAFMSDVDIVVPSSQNIVGRKLFTAFIYSMLSLNKYGLARYIPRNSKNGVTPKMVVLIPYRSAERQMFYLVQLPTVEDVRDYPFNSLKESNEEQKNLVRNLVKRMMLFNQDGEEEIKVENIFNPHRQYFYQSVFYRALNDKQDLPPLDPVIKDYMTPEVKKYEGIQPLMQVFRKTFKIEKKFDLDKKYAKKKMLVWKDLIDEIGSTNAQSQMMKQEQMGESEFIKPDNKFSFDEQEKEKEFNPTIPIVSFRKMVNYHKEDLVNKALNAMTNYIKNKIDFSVTQEAFRHLTECASELRGACASQQEESYWDTWFNNTRDSYNAFYMHMKSEGLGLLRGGNVEVFKAVEMHKADLDQDLFDLD